MDVLADMLDLLAPSRVLPARLEVSGAFRLVAQPFRHVHFATVLSGQTILEGAGWPSPILLRRDDAFLVTSGLSYSMHWGGPAEAVDGTALAARARATDGIARLGSGSPHLTMVGGRLICDGSAAKTVLDGLPPAIAIPGDAAEAASLRRTITMLAAEVARHAPGESLIVDRLADILLLQVLRAHPAVQEKSAGDAQDVMTDRRLLRALLMMHKEPGRDWTVDALAARAGCSRSAFAARFRQAVGVSPAAYLTRHRMGRVRKALTETDLPFKAIAFANGYVSRSACSKAFKRAFGACPSAFREGRKEGLLF